VSEPIGRRTAAVNGVELQVIEAGDPGAPPVILAHGFPESAFSWRHQLPTLAAAGFHAIAPDQRGYGGSSRPDQVAAYGIDALCDDLVALLDETGHEQGVFVGHDWGALIVWDLPRLRPERVRAVVGVSVPCPFWPTRPTEFLRAVMGDRFFYILYFQDVGPAERELEADVRTTLATVLWGGSGGGFEPSSELAPADGTGFLSGLPEPPPLPWTWLTEDDLDEYVAAFTRSGFFGPLSYYRNLDANYDRLADRPRSLLTMPSCHIAGERDVVLRMAANADARMAAELPGYRGQTLLPGVGHWTQQEDPRAFDAALLSFLSSLD
jgi:pimeloyl-ACP methyl ester carboxylesterase